MKFQFNRMFQTRHEKLLGLVTLLLIAVLVAKSLWLDPNLGALEDDQQTFQQLIEASLDSGYRDKWAYRYHLLAVRIVSIDEASKTEIEEASKVEAVPKYPYTAKVRRYLLGILPIGEFKLMK